MKKFALIVVLLLFAGCETVNGPTETPRRIGTDVKTTSWHQPYSELSEEWDKAKVHYQLENTGTITIRYYKILFEVNCADGSTHYGTVEKKYQNIYAGEVKSDYISISTAGKEAVSAKIKNWWISTNKHGYPE